MVRGKLPALFAAVAVAVALGGAAVAGGTAVAGAATGTPGRRQAAHPETVIIHRVTQPQARVRAFWTPRRLHQAAPVRLPAVAPGQRIPLGRPARRAISVPGIAPLMAPRLRKRSRIWANHSKKPATTVGKLFFQTSQGTGYCSAAVIRAPNESTIWTAGHCVSDGAGAWYSNFLFQPDRHDGIAPFGSFVARYAATTTRFFYRSDYRYDVAALALAASGESLQDRVGAQGVKMGGSSYRWRRVYDFGYPRDLNPSGASVDPEKLRYCVVSTSRDSRYGMMRFRCDMAHGSSGGPLLWHLRLRRGWGYLVGTMSLAARDSYQRWSPHLGVAAADVYTAVKNK